MKIFFLPCGCGSTIAVAAGQAGGQVRCDQCGATVLVPRLGDLARLAVPAAGPATPHRRWTIGHACLLAGAAVAAMAAVGAVCITAPTAAAVDVAGIRQAVSKASDGEVYRVWKQLARSGVARPPLHQERRLEQIARVAGAMSRWLVGLAVIGVAVAAAGGVAIMLRSPRLGSGE
jgi:hypothetical protein